MQPDDDDLDFGNGGNASPVASHPYDDRPHQPARPVSIAAIPPAREVTDHVARTVIGAASEQEVEAALAAVCARAPFWANHWKGVEAWQVADPNSAVRNVGTLRRWVAEELRKAVR